MVVKNKTIMKKLIIILLLFSSCAVQRVDYRTRYQGNMKKYTHVRSIDGCIVNRNPVLPKKWKKLHGYIYVY